MLGVVSGMVLGVVTVEVRLGVVTIEYVLGVVLGELTVEVL